MALFLVQHGKSLPKEKDPDQDLSEEGVGETKRIADAAKNYNLSVKSIKHSAKTRARQTAEIFGSVLQPVGGIQEVAGIRPLDDVAAYAKKIKVEDEVMLVGHLPFMERLTSYLITASIEKPVFKFQNSGIVCLDKDPRNQFWVITWTLMPHIG